MNVQSRLLLVILALGVLGACDDSQRSALTPLSPSFSETGDAIERHTAGMQVRVDELYERGDIDNAGIARGLKKLLANAGAAALGDDLKATENIMRAFQNRVRAQRGKHISEAAADELDADAQVVIDLSTGAAVLTDADLRVTLTAVPDPVTVGGGLTHAITASNSGPAGVTDLQISLLVVGTVEPGAAPPECTHGVAADGLVYDCVIPALDAGTDATLIIEVVPQTGGEGLSSQADLVNWTGADDPDLTNNLATVATLVNAPPAVQIDLPVDGSTYLQGAEITVAGTATDPEEGVLPPTALVWTSSIDGQIGTGEGFTRSDLSIGTHAITFTATDEHGGTGSVSVSVDVVASGTSQGGSLQWTQILGPVTGAPVDLYDAWGTSASNVWAVGAGQSRTSIVHYDGTGWTEQPTGTTAGFHAVWGSSSSDVFFAGAGGKIRHFDGTSWTFHETPTTHPLYDVWGTGSGEVWAVGSYTILYYDGTSWTEQHAGDRLWSVWGTSSTDVWAAGPSGIFHYDGTTWERQSTGISGHALAVGGSGTDVFFGGLNGYLAHYDGTSGTWTRLPAPDGVTNETFNGVWSRSPTDVYAVGSYGTLLHYDGASWTRVRAGGPTLRGVWGTPNAELFAVGQASTILQSTGAGWTVHSTAVELRSVWGASATDVFAVGGAGLVLHYDGSEWTAQNTGLTSHALTNADFYGVSGVSADDVWVVGRSGAVLRFDGAVWSEERPYGSGSNLHAVWANASDDVFAVGAASTLLHFDGTSWNAQSSPITSNFHDVFGAAGDAVWAVGSTGAIARYDGTSWSRQASGTSASLLGVWAAGINHVVATGTMPDVLIWDGAAWTPRPLGVSGAYSGRGIWGASLNDIFSIPGGSGGAGSVLHYDGSTWSRQDTGIGNVGLYDLWGSSATNVYAVGWGGTIVRSSP